MINLLAELFIKDYKNRKSPEVRTKYGALCGGVGIFFNVLLFIGKFIAGFISGSIAVTADALNNLSDAGSSVITLIGFKLAGSKPDREHPYGHGRIEYLSGLVVSMIIIFMGFELAISSFDQILHPSSVSFSALTICVLAASILVKLYMALYNRKIGKEIGSSALNAAAIDSMSDVCATAAVLLAAVASQFISFSVDGYIGILVSCFIIFSGFKAGKETIEPLLGTPPSRELINSIEEIVLSHEPIRNMHDLVVHDYGPGRLILSLHAEVPADADILYIHEVIDHIEFELTEKLGCEAVIHADPIDYNNEHLTELRKYTLSALMELDKNLTMHDFRMVPGVNRTNVIFDVVVPIDCKLRDEEIKSGVQQSLFELSPEYFCVIKLDRNYCN